MSCDECEFLGDVGEETCLKGHEPEFIYPLHFGAMIRGDWGYKRRDCSDFKESD